MIRITSRSGRELILTPDHELLSINSWQASGTLKIGDYIAEAAKYNFEQKPSVQPKAFFHIMGYIIGDGSYPNFNRVTFSTTSDIYFQDFQKNAKAFDLDFSAHSYQHNTILNFIGKEHVVRIYGGKDGFKKVLRELGMIGQYSQFKNIAFLNLFKNNGDIIAFLSRLYATDGYVCVSRSKNEGYITVDIGYVTTSKELAEDVQDVLLRLGIRAWLRKRLPSNSVSKLVQYIVMIRDKDNALKFLNKVSIFGKEAKCEEGIRLLKTCASGKARYLPIRAMLYERAKAKGLSYESLWIKHKLSLPRKGNISRDKAKRLIALTKAKDLEWLVSDDIEWEPIIAIEDAGLELAFDMTIETNHNFIANGIITHNCIDEIQDIVSNNIAVISEVLSHAPNPTRIFSGTPKSLDNTIESYWQLSSQCEWMVPCEHHLPRHWNFLDDKCIGKTGPVCNKCGKPIDPRMGQWVAMSNIRDIMSFRISQIMVYWTWSVETKWQEFLWKFEHYSRAQFFNECLGISYDSASKPITLAELTAACKPNRKLIYHPKESHFEKSLMFAGIDWGEGADGVDKNPSGKIRAASYTVLTIGIPITATDFHFCFVKKYIGDEADPNFFMPDIIKWLNVFNVQLVGVDWGHGAGNIANLRKGFGIRKVIPFFYHGTQKERRTFDSIGAKYVFNRNIAITEFIENIKNQRVSFPRWSDIEKYVQDIMNVYVEYNEFKRTMKYDHRPGNPDDFMHSCIYCKEAYNIYYQKGASQFEVT